jgi:hypothetical protein
MSRLIKLVVTLLMVSLTQCDDCVKSDKCNLVPDLGPCNALFTRYYYDKQAKECKPFDYGGCGGVVPFETMEECKKGCTCQ